MFQTLHEISKNLVFVFVWKYVWKYVNINVSDIKKKEMKETIAKINKTKSWFFEKIKKLINRYPDSSRKKRKLSLGKSLNYQ